MLNAPTRAIFQAALAALLALLAFAAPTSAGGADTRREFIHRVNIVNLGFEVQLGRPWKRYAIAPVPVLDQLARERLVSYLYLIQGKEADIVFRDGWIVGAALPGAGGLEPQDPPPLDEPGRPAWSDRPALVLLFREKAIDPGDLGLTRAEFEARHSCTLAPDGMVAYADGQRDIPGRPVFATLDAIGRIDSVAGRIMFVTGREMAAQPVAQAVAALVGPADRVETRGWDISMRSFVGAGQGCLEYSLELRPLAGSPRTGTDHFGFEALGRIVKIGQPARP